MSPKSPDAIDWSAETFISSAWPRHVAGGTGRAAWRLVSAGAEVRAWHQPHRGRPARARRRYPGGVAIDLVRGHRRRARAGWRLPAGPAGAAPPSLPGPGVFAPRRRRGLPRIGQPGAAHGAAPSAKRGDCKGLNASSACVTRPGWSPTSQQGFRFAVAAVEAERLEAIGRLIAAEQRTGGEDTDTFPSQPRRPR